MPGQKSRRLTNLPTKPTLHDPEFWTTAKIHKSFNEKKLCIAASNADSCEGQIIGAHTVPRSQLERIADDGHVYAIKGDLPTFNKTGGQIEMSKRGIGQFSVLNCFCQKHDRELFASVETKTISGTPEQVAALHYRAMGSELYRKITSVEVTKEFIKTKAGGRNRGFVQSMLIGSQLGLLDSGKTIKRCEQAMFDERYDALGALVINFKEPPSIMTVGGYNPQFDYHGKHLQSLANKELHEVSFSILSAENRAIVILAWLKPSDVAKKFVASFCEQVQNLWTTLLIQTSFSHLENTCANISWWNALKGAERDSLLGRMQETISLPGPHPNGSYMKFCGIKFDDWKYQSHFFVNP
jgi:hypothetical protein